MDSLIWNMCVLCWHFFSSWNFLNSDVVLEAGSVCVICLAVRNVVVFGGILMFHIGIGIQLLFNCDMIVAYNSVWLIS